MKVVLEEKKKKGSDNASWLRVKGGWGSPEDLCTSPLLESLLSHKEVKKERVHGLREGGMRRCQQ